MVVSASDRAWIESHGGTVGVVSAQEAFQRGGAPSPPPGAIMPATEYYAPAYSQQQGLWAQAQAFEEAGRPGLTKAISPLGAIGAAAGALGIPAAIVGGIGAVGAGIAAYQALGGGEGEGLFGLDILGGPAGQYVDGIPLGGPGLAEPSASMLVKEWHVNYDWGRLQYYLVQMPTGGRKIAMYNTRTKVWKAWRWSAPRLAVIGKNMPSHRMLTRLSRNLHRHAADAKTILKIVSPTAYAKQLGYKRYKRR